MDQPVISEESLIYFLHAAGKTLGSEYPAFASYLNIHRSNLSSRLNLDLPSDRSKKNVVCMHCLTPWSFNLYTLRLLEAVKPNSKIRSVLRKKEKNLKCSYAEKKLAALAHFGNKLILKCHVCHEMTSFMIFKNLKTDSKNLIIKKMRKKKKKDPFAGLSAQISNGNHLEKNFTEEEDETEKSGFMTPGNRAFNLQEQHCQREGFENKCSSGRNAIPLGTKHAGSSTKTEFGFQKIKVSKETKFVNPFALLEGSKKKKKKTDHLQRMIASKEAENKRKSSSFRDFLSLVS